MSRQLAEEEPFNFLGLPKEVRLMVYERIPVITTHHTITSSSLHLLPDGFRLVTTTAPVAILATCRKIRKEADAILQSRARWIETLTTPGFPRFIFHHDDLINLPTFLSILDETTADLRFYRPSYDPKSPTLWKDPAIEKALYKIPALQTREKEYRQPIRSVCFEKHWDSAETGGFSWWWFGCPTRMLTHEFWRADIESVGCHVDFSRRSIKLRVYGLSRQVGYIEEWTGCSNCGWNITVEYLCEARWTKEWAEGEQL